MYKRSSAIKQKTLGEHHPSVAIDLNNLVLLYYSQGKYAEAEPLFQRSLPIYEKSLRKDHANTKKVRANLEAL